MVVFGAMLDSEYKVQSTGLDNLALIVIMLFSFISQILQLISLLLKERCIRSVRNF